MTDHLLDRVAGRLAAVEARLGAVQSEAGRTAVALARVVAELDRGSFVSRVARRVRRLAGRAVSRAPR